MSETTGVFCYECHEELLHNPVFLPEDIVRFANVVKARRLGETTKKEDRAKIAGRIRLLNEVIKAGLEQIASLSHLPQPLARHGISRAEVGLPTREGCGKIAEQMAYED